MKNPASSRPNCPDRKECPSCLFCPLRENQTKSRVALGFFLHSAFCILPSPNTFQPIPACAYTSLPIGLWTLDLEIWNLESYPIKPNQGREGVFNC